MNPPANVPQPARELLVLVAGLDEDALRRIGGEYRRQYATKLTLDALAAWIRQDEAPRRAWYQSMSRWIAALVQERFGTWQVDDEPKFIRPALEAACLATVMYAADMTTPEVYRDACRGFHAAFVSDAA